MGPSCCTGLTLLFTLEPLPESTILWQIDPKWKYLGLHPAVKWMQPPGAGQLSWEERHQNRARQINTLFECWWEDQDSHSSIKQCQWTNSGDSMRGWLGNWWPAENLPMTATLEFKCWEWKFVCALIFTACSVQTQVSQCGHLQKNIWKKKNESAVLHNALHMPFLELARETFWLSKCEIESKHAMRHWHGCSIFERSTV